MTIEEIKALLEKATPKPFSGNCSPDSCAVFFMCGETTEDFQSRCDAILLSSIPDHATLVLYLVEAIRGLIPFAEDYTDEGPLGEGWQSDELRKALNTALGLLRIMGIKP